MHPKYALSFPLSWLLAELAQNSPHAKILRLVYYRSQAPCPFAEARQTLRQFRSSRWLTFQCGLHHARDP